MKRPYYCFTGVPIISSVHYQFLLWHWGIEFINCHHYIKVWCSLILITAHGWIAHHIFIGFQLINDWMVHNTGGRQNCETAVLWSTIFTDFYLNDSWSTFHWTNNDYPTHASLSITKLFIFIILIMWAFQIKARG